MDCLIQLLGDGLVVLASRRQERIALAWLRDRNIMLIQEGFQLRIGPAA